MDAELDMAIETLKPILDEMAPMDMVQPQGLPGLESIPDFRDLTSYQMFQSEGMPTLLTGENVPYSLVTVSEDQLLNTLGGFSRAPGDGRLPAMSLAGHSGQKIMGRPE